MVIEVRHIGNFGVSPDALMRMLRMEGGILMDVTINHDTALPLIEFKIEHPDMPEVQDGDVIPTVLPTYTEMKCEHGLTVYDRVDGPIT